MVAIRATRMLRARAVGLYVIGLIPKRIMVARYPGAPPWPEFEDNTAKTKILVVVSSVSMTAGSKEVLY